MEMAGAIRTSENNPGLRCKNREICAVMTGLYSAFVTSVPAFAAGESYLITITLYGPQEIKITTTLDDWDTSDQDIKIGQDD